jgi:hypothetical protein
MRLKAEKQTLAINWLKLSYVAHSQTCSVNDRYSPPHKSTTNFSRILSPKTQNKSGAGASSTLKNPKTETPHPYPNLSNKSGANNGTTPPKIDLKRAPAAIALAGYFSKESM